MWHILQDPSSNQFFRLNNAAYQFVALLDGERTVADAWRICNDQLGDEAPTQGEAIQLLGQLYTSNLLQAELPPDTEGLFRRYRQRRGREVRGYVSNLLFARFPLLNPDRFLDRWVGVFGRVFSWYGFVIWLGLICAGLYVALGNWSGLAERGQHVLDPANLPLLYLSFILIKVIHEFSHAFACKKYGLAGGSGGEVHTMGIMLLVFTPMPYVDASSAWAFRRKRHRVIVGAAGMLVELAVASIAAIVWVNTGQGTAAHEIAYNVMFIASISTLLFNGNPLLRFDAYYILSDALEIPNLSQRSKEYLYYLVKRYAWGVRRARSPANTRGERVWFAFYGVASTAYRVFICIRILMFIVDKLFFLGAVLAVAAFVAWVLVPLGKFLRYLATGPELARNRPRAVVTTLLVAGGLFAALGMMPFDDHVRAEAVVEPLSMAVVHALEDGRVEDVLESGATVFPAYALSFDGAPAIRAAMSPGAVPALVPTMSAFVAAYDTPLVRLTNPDLLTRYEQLLVARRRLRAQRGLAWTEGPASVQYVDLQLAALANDIRRVGKQVQSLQVPAPLAGTWVSPAAERIKGAYVRRGERIGIIADLDDLVIRAVANQRIVALLIEEIEIKGNDEARNVEIRVKGRPGLELRGRVRRIYKAGHANLPSQALGYAAGGSIETALSDPRGLKAAERFFEIHIQPDPQSSVRLLSGQRVMVRFALTEKPLAAQWWRWILQVVQKRFRI
jgi:putative peptide zinc metalloprotease protein